MAGRSHPEEPVLLSGGNPQIPKGDGREPVTAYLDAMPGWKQDAGRLVDRLVTEIVPDVRQAVRWNSPFYGVEGSGWFLNIHCLNSAVKVTFFAGADLDPPPPGAGKDPSARWFNVDEAMVTDAAKTADAEASLRSWIAQAARLQGWDGF